MGANNGTGQPNWFRCHQARRGMDGSHNDGRHAVTLTGRWKEVSSTKGGARVSDRRREYVCSCGHVGWSRHVDLARMAGEPRIFDHPEWG